MARSIRLPDAEHGIKPFPRLRDWLVEKDSLLSLGSIEQSQWSSPTVGSWYKPLVSTYLQKIVSDKWTSLPRQRGREYDSHMFIKGKIRLGTFTYRSPHGGGVSVRP